MVPGLGGGGGAAAAVVVIVVMCSQALLRLDLTCCILWRLGRMQSTASSLYSSGRSHRPDGRGDRPCCFQVGAALKFSTRPPRKEAQREREREIERERERP